MVAGVTLLPVFLNGFRVQNVSWENELVMHIFIRIVLLEAVKSASVWKCKIIVSLFLNVSFSLLQGRLN